MKKRTTDYMHVGVGTFEATERMKAYIDDVLESGRISYGKYSKVFEKKFAKVHGCEYAILSNSGTSALLVALQAMKEIHGWEDYDEVIIPATTFIATANIVIHARLTPKFVDIEHETFGIDGSKLIHKKTPRTRAIIPVHLFGQAGWHTKGVVNFANEFDLKIIEDSCETMFVKRHGAPVGSIGDIGCFSTYVAHILTTGVGGISTTNNPDYAAKMRSLVNHGLTIENLNPTHNFQPQPMIGRHFTFDSVGHSFRITEFEAALGLAQLDDIEKMGNYILRGRRKNARHISATLIHLNKHYNADIKIPTEYERNQHAWMMYPILLPRDQSKREFTKFLNERGIETRDLPSILDQPIYNLDHDAYPISKWVNNSGFYVGCHQDLTPEQMDWLTQSLRDFYAKEKYG